MKKEQYYYFDYVDPTNDTEYRWEGSFYELCCRLGIKGKELRYKMNNEPESLPYNIHSGTYYSDFKYNNGIDDHSFCNSKQYWNQLCSEAQGRAKDYIDSDFSDYEPTIYLAEESINIVFDLNCRIDDYGECWFVVLPKQYYSFIIKKGYNHFSTMKRIFTEIEEDIKLCNITDIVKSKVKYCGWLNWNNINNKNIHFDLKLKGQKKTNFWGNDYYKYMFFDIKPNFKKLQYIYY